MAGGIVAKISVAISDDLENSLQKLADERFNGDINQVVVAAIEWWVDKK